MGLELVRQLVAAGRSVTACDVNPQTVGQTAALAGNSAPPGIRVTGHRCDVSDELPVLRFRDELLAEHGSGRVSGRQWALHGVTVNAWHIR
jgi:NAD(P)-dependent dehydrogenase (short-subunit alcohol dehydrogenase family)